MTDGRSGARDRAVRSVTSGPTVGLIASGGNEWRPPCGSRPTAG